MGPIKDLALAVTLLGAMAACTDDRAATDPVADDSPTTSATQPPDCPAVAFHHEELDPGCWAIQARGLPGSPLAELDLPTGFSGNDAWVWVNDVPDDEWGAITLTSVGDVYPDPCRRAGNPPEVGPSVQDFASALFAQEVTAATRPDPVTLDGHPGLFVEVSVPAGFDVSTCRDEELILWNGTGGESPGAEPGLVSRFWVLDVDGQRVVLSMATSDDANHESMRRFLGIVEEATFAEG